MPLRQIQVADFGGINQNDQDEVLIRQSFQGSQGGMNQIAPVESPNLKNIDFVQGGLKQRSGSVTYKTIPFTAGDSVLVETVEWEDPATAAIIEVAVTDKSIYAKTGSEFVQVNTAGGAAYTHASDVTKASFTAVDGHLFIGLNGANNYIQVYRSGSALDDQLNNTAAVSEITQDASIGDNDIFVSDISSFAVHDRVVLNKGITAEADNYITSLNSGAFLTLLNTLLFNYVFVLSFVEVATPFTRTIQGVVFADDLWVAVGRTSGGVNLTIMTSTDGSTWVDRSHNGDNGDNLWDVSYGNNAYIAVGESGIKIRSIDGINWAELSNSTVTFRSIDYSGSLFVTVGFTAGGLAPYIETSPDGTTWTSRSPVAGNGNFFGVAYGNGLWVAVGRDVPGDAYIEFSSNGITWSVASSVPAVSLVNEVAYGNNIWVAVGQTDGVRSVILTSPDGNIWTQRTTGVTKNINLRDVIFDSSSGLFYAVGDADGVNALVLYSDDGITWVEIDGGGKNFNLFAVNSSQTDIFAAGESDGADAYAILSNSSVNTVEVENQYVEAFDTETKHDITGAWDKAAYLLTELHARLLFSTANTLVNFTQVASTSGGGIWNGSANGFLQVNGNIKSLESFAPELSDSLKDALYIGTQKGYEITTGFGTTDVLIRIEGAKSPINHRSVVKASNWLIYLTDDKNVMAINGSNVINLGRRLKNQKQTGVLDTISTDETVTRGFGYYNPDKKQAFFHFQTQDTYDNDTAVMLDFQLGEPVRGEPQGGFERRVRCSAWEVDPGNDWISGAYIVSNSTKGFKEDGTIYTLESGKDDFASLAVNGHWEFPEFAGGVYSRLKQWFRLNGIFDTEPDPGTIDIDVFLDQSDTSIFTGKVFNLFGSVLTIVVNTTYPSPDEVEVPGNYHITSGITVTIESGATLSILTEAISTGSQRIDRRSKYMRFSLSNSNLDESFTIKNVLVRYDIGAEIQN
jgi:hypothetical protein